MKKTLPLLITFFVLINTLKVSAQISFSDLVKSTATDAGKLLTAYANPIFKGFGAGMNNNWNNTAKTKKLLHFDIRISGTGATVPTSDKSFDVTKIGLSNNLRPVDPSQTISPTISGDKNTSPIVLNQYDKNGTNLGQINLPSGKGLPLIPSPQLQITIGLPKNTDVTIRSIPTINLGDNAGSVSMVGFGLKHNIMQDFAGMAGKLVPFDLAVAFGFSRLNTTTKAEVQPDNGATPENNQQSTDFSNQRFETHFNSFMVQAIISKKLLFFTPFLAVGYNNASTNIALLGNYPVTSGVSSTFQPTYTTLTNPVNIKETTLSGMRADMGFQLNLAIFRIYGSYSMAKYKSLSGGFGFGF